MVRLHPGEQFSQVNAPLGNDVDWFAVLEQPGGVHVPGVMEADRWKDLSHEVQPLHAIRTSLLRARAHPSRMIRERG